MGAMRIGTSMTVIVAFESDKVPRHVRYVSMLYQCSVHSKQNEVCRRCGKVGHRLDVCLTPNARVFLACSGSNPREDHKCVPKCRICGEGHPTRNKVCRARFKILFMVRGRNWERRYAEKQRRQRMLSPGSFPQLGDVASRDTGASRHASWSASHRRASRSVSRRPTSLSGYSSGSASRHGQEPPVGVSWADATKGENKMATNGHKYSGNQCFKQRIMANEATAKKLAEL